MRRSPRPLRSAIPLAALLCATTAAGCRDAASPSIRELVLAIAPAFQGGTSGLVDVATAHFTVFATDERIVLDTIVAIPDGASTVDIVLMVPLEGGATGAIFFLTMELFDSLGNLVFVGGAEVTALPPNDGTPSAVPIDLVYVGPGANAASVLIEPPQTANLFGVVAVIDFNAAAVYSAMALDVNEQPIPGTPIAWRSLDPAVADVPDISEGRVVAGPSRGEARIVAELLTGPADTLSLLVAPPDEFIPVAVDDPVADTFGQGGFQQDILVFGAAVDAASILIGIQFTGDVAPANEFATNSVVGFVDLDVDQNVQTGVTPQTDVFRPVEDTNTSGLGAEYFISLFDVDVLGEVPLVDATTGVEMARLSTVFERDVVIITIPLSLIGDDGSMNLATIVGTAGEQTDLAPNAGALTSFGSLPAPPRLWRRPAPQAAPPRSPVPWSPRR